MVKCVYKDPPEEHNKIPPGETDDFINFRNPKAPKAHLSEVAIIPASSSPARDILLRHAPIVIPSEKNHKLAVDPNEFHSKKWDKPYNVKSGPIVRRPYIESYKTGKPDVYSRAAESLSCGSSKQIVFDRMGMSKPPLWSPVRESYFATASEREKSKSIGEFKDLREVLQRKLQQSNNRKNFPDLRTKLSRENPNKLRDKEHKTHFTVEPVPPSARDKEQKVELLIKPVPVPSPVLNFKPNPRMENIYKDFDKFGYLLSSIDKQFLGNTVVSMGALEDPSKVLQKKLQQSDDKKNLPDLRTKLTRKNPNRPKDKKHKAHCTMKSVLPPSRDKEQKVQLLIKPLPLPAPVSSLKAREEKHEESEHKNEKDSKKDRCFRPCKSMQRQSNFAMDSPELMEHMKLYSVEDNKYITPTDNEPIVRPKLKRQKTIDSSGGISSNSSNATNKAIKQKNEKVFDKMTNLALSSFTETRVASNIEKKQKSGLSKKEEAQLPVFVPPTERYVCWASYCHYLCRDETTFRYHLQALHCDESIYKCTHCLKTLRPEKGIINMESIIKHLRLHDLQLYKCSKCKFVHNLKHEVERHVFYKHTDKPARVIIVRDMCTHEKRHWFQNVKGATNYEAIQHSKQAHPGMEGMVIAVPTPSTSTIKPIMRKRKYPSSAWEIPSSSDEVQAKQPTLATNEILSKWKTKQCLPKGSIRYKCCYCNCTGSLEVLKRHFRIEHPGRDLQYFSI